MHIKNVKLGNGLGIDIEHYNKSGNVMLQLVNGNALIETLVNDASPQDVIASLDELRETMQELQLKNERRAAKIAGELKTTVEPN